MKEFPIPKELTSLITDGLWPKKGSPVDRQMLHPLISESAVRKFAREESTVILFPPPFTVVRTLMEGREKAFWSDPRIAVIEIDPDRTLLIGDFGLGSDALIALDYRKNENEPAVIRLRWAQEGNHWIEVAPDFATFATYIKSNFISPSAGGFPAAASAA